MTTNVSVTTLSEPTLRRQSYVSSFAQTDCATSSNMVDLDSLPTTAELADDIFRTEPTAIDDDCPMSDASSIYQTFDEIYELEDGNVVARMEEVCKNTSNDTLMSTNSQ